MEHFLKVVACFQTELAKGSELLKEVTLIREKTSVADVTGVKEVAQELSARVDGFATELDNVRDVIDDTAKCYELLDKVGSSSL